MECTNASECENWDLRYNGPGVLVSFPVAQILCWPPAFDNNMECLVRESALLSGPA